MKIADCIKWAVLSPCGRYRFLLGRANPDVPPEQRKTLAFVLNNPSVADASVDDPTATRGWGFTEALGFDQMIFANTNPARATDPRCAWAPPEMIQRENDMHLRTLAWESAPIVLAWGDKANPAFARRATDILFGAGAQPLHHLHTLTNSGNPRHILYLPANAKLNAFSMVAGR